MRLCNLNNDIVVSCTPRDQRCKLFPSLGRPAKKLATVGSLKKQVAKNGRFAFSLDMNQRTASGDKIAGFYRDAYGWTPPRLDIGELLTGKSMRQYVKSWITSWDIERLYGQTPQIEAETIATDYSESSEIEQAPADDGEDDSAG